MIKKNVGGKDKYIRIILGLILVGVGYIYGNIWATIFGGILFFTGWYERCGLYALIGVSTCKKPL